MLHENTILCDGVGEVVFSDADGKKFYLEYQMRGSTGLMVKLGDCVRIELEVEDEETTTQGFGQITAIYETSEEEIFAEVRWLLPNEELSQEQRERIKPAHNELVESDSFDDIAAGAVSEVIEVKGLKSNQNKLSTSNHFVCKSLVSSQTRTVQKVSSSTMLKRSMDMSQYKYAYVEHLSNGSSLIEGDAFSLAIQRLHLSVIPENLPCRSQERARIESYIRSGIDPGSNSSGPAYRGPFFVCGTPGTGKTATVLSSINSLRKEVAAGTLKDFRFIEINCLHLKSANDAYSQLWRGLSGYYLAPQSAHKRLIQYFDDAQNGSIKVRAQDGVQVERPLLLCMVDEIDFLLTRDCKVIFEFFDWSLDANSGFLLLGIANTLDLLERLSLRVESRLKSKIEIARAKFAPYTHEQIHQILEHRLAELHLEGIDSRAREFIARKAAATAGDLRAALKICRMTIELYRDHISELKRSSVGHAKIPEVPVAKIFSLVKLAADNYRQSPFIAVASACCDLEIAILIVYCKQRRLITGDDASSPDSGLTESAAFDRLGDLMARIDTDQKIGKLATDSASTSADIDSRNEQKVSLVIPPRYIFLEALERLQKKSLLSTAISYLACGKPITTYHVHANFFSSDLVAAIRGRPWERYFS